MTTRQSQQREAILEAVRKTDTHPTAEWVYARVRKELPRVSLGTVYRNLKRLVQENKISELDTNGTANRFDSNTQIHHHFLCEHCGKLLDFTNDKQMENAMLASIAENTGFKITNHRCELTGLCPDCQA